MKYKIKKLPRNEYEVEDIATKHITKIEKTALEKGILSLEQEISTKQEILKYRKSILTEINKII